MELSKRPMIFLVNKPSGMTSNDVIYYFKKNLNFEFGKIGHLGTLDPFASGVFLIGIQGAQKINDFVHELFPKTYFARGIFGKKTYTGDLTSEFIESKDIDKNWQNASLDKIEKNIRENFIGEYWQRPHQFSAAKFEGKRLYEYARSGVTIEKSKVKREILEFKISKFNYPDIEFTVTVSSGTYIRSFFEDISEYLGGVGHLKELIRTSIGELNLEDSLSKELWPTFETGTLEIINKSYKLDQILRLNRIELSQEMSKRFLQGVRFRADQIEVLRNSMMVCSEKYYWIYDQIGHLLGLALIDSGELQALFTYQDSY